MRKVTWLQSPTVLWLGGGTISPSYSACMGLRMLAEIHTAEPLVHEPSASEVELAVDKQKSHKSPGIGQIPAELIKAAGRTIFLEITNLLLLFARKDGLRVYWMCEVLGELIVIQITIL